MTQHSRAGRCPRCNGAWPDQQAPADESHAAVGSAWPERPQDAPPDTPHRIRHVAVIIAAYRAAAWIGDCLRSLADSALTLGAGVVVEYRIGVDACEATAAELERLRVAHYWTPENVGAYVLRNSLIAAADADAFLIFDADDRALADYVPLMLRRLWRAPIVGPSRIECDEQLRPLDSYALPRRYRHGVCGIRRDAWHTLGGFKAERYGADCDLIARAAQAGLEVAPILRPLYMRRRHPESLTRHPDTGIGSTARADAWRRMSEQRRTQHWHVEPVTVSLEFRNPSATNTP